MTVKYYAILTNQGAARLANATMLGSKLNLTQMAVGDANGVLPTPDPAPVSYTHLPRRFMSVIAAWMPVRKATKRPTA